MKPLINFLFILILVSTLISAQPPFTQITDDGLSIDFVKINSHQQNQNFQYNFHVFNISNGIKLTNSTTSCTFHLFDNKGAHIVQEVSISFDVTGGDWQIDVNSGNFSRLGQYAYLVDCQSTEGFGGAVSVGFIVTADGNERDVFPYQFSVIIFGFLLIAFGSTNQRRRLFKYAGSVIFMVMGVATAWEGYGFINYSTLIGQLLSTVLIATGFYFLIEDSFSRDEQSKRFDQFHDDELEEDEDNE